MFTGAYLLSKKISNDRIALVNRQKQLKKEKDIVIHFVEEKLYHNQLTSLYYITFKDYAHYLQIQYQGRYYRIQVVRVFGTSDFSYQIQELQSHQIYNVDQFEIVTQPINKERN